MPELFDLIAGSETGAIIASSLVIPKDKDSKDDWPNKYFAERSVNFFKEHGENLYHTNSLPTWIKIIIIMGLITIIGATIMYWFKGFVSFELHDDLVNSIKMVITLYKKKLKKQLS